MQRTRGSASALALRRAGVAASLGAYTLWGLFPLYFKALRASPPEVLVHRIIWSAVFLCALLAGQRRWGALRAVLRAPRQLLGSALSASLLSLNWFIYLWAVHAERVVDASLGYFITPLLSVLFGVLLLGEALRPRQWLALATAAGGVLWLTFEFGQLPVVGLALAASFGTYAVLRKTARLGALEGLALETWLMFPVALAYLLWLAARGQSRFVSGPSSQQLLLLAAGPLTSVPLLLFAAGARRIPLSLAGVLQYVSPSLQLLLGVYVWHEPFTLEKLVGYALIWLAVVIYTGESWWGARRALRAAD